MEPLPETAEALAEIGMYGDTQPEQLLRRLGEIAQDLVPELVGFSVTMVEEGITLTLAASSAEIAVLDAFQYLDGGPCERAVDRDEVVRMTPEDALDEDTWHLYALSTAAAGVRSTLSLPLTDGGRVVGGINMYASSRDAFVGKGEALAAALGAVAADSVVNADLQFSTRAEAAAAPGRLQEMQSVDFAVGMLAEARKISVDEARSRISRAAARAGIDEAAMAQAVSTVLRPAGR